MNTETHAAPHSAFRIPHSAFIALGSNLGDPVANVRAAMIRLADLSTVPILKSSLWSSTPVDCPSGSPMFVNAVVGLVPREGETPESLLAKLQEMERESGRAPKVVMNEPRTLDLDLIAFGNEARSTASLTLPHPRAHERRFVLEPLCEIAPDIVLPGMTKPVATNLAELQGDEELIRLGPARG